MGIRIDAVAALRLGGQYMRLTLRARGLHVWHPLVCLLGVLLLGADLSAEDPLRETWIAHVAALRSLEVEMSVRPRLIAPWYDVAARFDLEMDRLKGTKVVKIADPKVNQIDEQGFGQTSTNTWHSDRLSNGTQRFDINPSSRFDQKAIVNTALGLPGLRLAYEPHHRQYAAVPGVTVTLTARSPSQAIKGAERLVYTVAKGNQTGTVTYDLDLSDGVRIYRTEVRRDGWLAVLIENKDFVKDNGIWFPRECSYRELEKQGPQQGAQSAPVADLTEFKISAIKINRIYTEADFKPAMKEGDMVYDNVLGTQYWYKRADDELSLGPSDPAKADGPAGLSARDTGPGRAAVGSASGGAPSEPAQATLSSGSSDRGRRATGSWRWEIAAAGLCAAMGTLIVLIRRARAQRTTGAGAGK